MRRILFTLLALIFVLALFAAVGYAGYRVGYVQGAQITANGQAPGLRPFDEWGPRRMPMHDFGFERGFPMMGWGFFPLLFLGRLVVLALVLWFAYWLFTRSGLRLTRQTTEPVPPKAETE